MILSTTSTDRPVRPELTPAPTASRNRPVIPPSDQISTESARFLRAELNRQPEIRSEVVARGRALVADPNYPSMAALRKVAEQILKSPDLTEDES